MELHQTAKENEIRLQVKRLAELMDSKFQLPMGIRVGWDGVLGLIPGIGDLATNAVSFYILYRAAMVGCPPSVILRMALNIFIDNILDMIPIVGNIFDFFWRSNLKNVALLEQFLTGRKEVIRNSRLVIALIVVSMLALFLGMMAIVFMTLGFMWQIVVSL